MNRDQVGDDTVQQRGGGHGIQDAGGEVCAQRMSGDDDRWPLGPNGFWESFNSADVLQHRLFVVLILGFSAFEWGIATGRLRNKTAAMVFPLVCALGGALLMTHSHSPTNVREQLLIEVSHLPLAVLAVAAGWTRWMALRLPRADQVIPSKVWPVCLTLLGVVLLLYREA